MKILILIAIMFYILKIVLTMMKLANYLKLDTNLINPTTTQNLGRSVQTALNKCLCSDRLKSTDFNFMTTLVPSVNG